MVDAEPTDGGWRAARRTGSLRDMTALDARADRWLRVVAGTVTFVTLHQGAVPLVARGVFGREQRFAPALWLPAPWWWVACLAITGLGIALLAGVEAARHRPPAANAPPAVTPPAVAPPEVAPPDPADRTSGYDALAGLVFLVGIYNGVAPFVSRLLLDGDLLLALPLRLPSPWWWVASLAVIVATLVLLEAIDRAKGPDAT